MNEILKKEYNTIDEVVLKPNQVLIKPIRPILQERASSKAKIKNLISNSMMFLMFAVGIFLLFSDEPLKVIGGVLIGATIVYTISIFKK
jgi:hypothetical protein